MEALQLLAPFGFIPPGLIHVGANNGGELAAYRAAGVATVVYVEPAPGPYQELCARIAGTDGYHAIQALCSAAAGEKMIFNIADNGGKSSSLLALGNHSALRMLLQRSSDSAFRASGAHGPQTAAPLRFSKPKPDGVQAGASGSAWRILERSLWPRPPCRCVTREFCINGRKWPP